MQRQETENEAHGILLAWSYFRSLETVAAPNMWIRRQFRRIFKLKAGISEFLSLLRDLGGHNFLLRFLRPKSGRVRVQELCKNAPLLAHPSMRSRNSRILRF